MERLQKVIAQAGVCSRRKAEEYITAGKVKVNGKVCTTLGTKVSGNDLIEVNGTPIEREDAVYYVFYKPKGCVCTVSDDLGRKTVMDYLPKDKRIYPVGRLDYDTSGVLLMTNDGAFTNLMTHPRYHIPKTYVVNLQGRLEKEDVKKIRKGFNGYQPAKIFFLDNDPERDRMRFELTIYEGKNHEVKNMMKELGYEVRRLHRKTFGTITADDLRPGQYRRLKPHEIKELKRLAQEGSR
ncbi:pseudouridine synthase [Catenisphaera adipataccumulans]|jgi:23S rRNA pseudouridine2605 synthase|uniref:Pseudouridine synthase n=1 Tax=Catenisphaera adipataccumulans TaxID=700500 RepID=A0A7W8CX78_9FIRM|nr:pseudouridine synthase [Catenisphaera adipataccumulans]MBB5183285.1 23S rRNA pseudouridine2605 synthase [Catenisphaera adipataccumulans]